MEEIDAPTNHLFYFAQVVLGFEKGYGFECLLTLLYAVAVVKP